jgi:hypothetical protein
MEEPVDSLEVILEADLGRGCESYLSVSDLIIGTAGQSPPVTTCAEVDYISLTGPPTATVSVAATYKLEWGTSEQTEVSTTIGVDEGALHTEFIKGASGEGYQEYFFQWFSQGVHTVTARVSTPCDYAEASVSTTITSGIPVSVVVPLLDIGSCDASDPDSLCYLDCSECASIPDNLLTLFSVKLVCYLICLFQWLGAVMYWVALASVNALIGAFNVVLTWDGGVTADIIHTIEWYELTWSNFFEQSFANLGRFFGDHILAARDWMYDGLTWLADEIEIGGDVFGDQVEAFFTELGEWTQTNLNEFGEFANDSITNYGDSQAANIENFRDWSNAGLLELAEYFSSWGTGLGDFLALLVTAVADFLYSVLTIFADFTRNLYDQIGNLVEAAFIWLGQALYLVLSTIGKILNELITGVSLFIADLIRALRDFLYVWMTVFAWAVESFFVGLGKFLAMVIHGVANFLIMLVNAFNVLMFALSYAAQLALMLITMAVEAILQVYAAIIWVSTLILQMLDALVSGLQSDTTPEMYQGDEGAFYFWRGLSFFEEIAESSPLDVVNYVAMGLIGINLLFWTLKQFGEMISDVLEFA